MRKRFASQWAEISPNVKYDLAKWAFLSATANSFAGLLEKIRHVPPDWLGLTSVFVFSLAGSLWLEIRRGKGSRLSRSTRVEGAVLDRVEVQACVTVAGMRECFVLVGGTQDSFLVNLDQIALVEFLPEGNLKLLLSGGQAVQVNGKGARELRGMLKERAVMTNGTPAPAEAF